MVSIHKELEQLALDFLGHQPEIVNLQGDGSERKIYRMFPKEHRLKSLIGVYHSDLLENEAFIYLTKRMRALGLPAPEIYSLSKETSCYLLEDLGEHTLAEKVKEWNAQGDTTRVLEAYKQVIDLMPLMQENLPELLGNFLQYRQMGHPSYVADILYFQDNFLGQFELLDFFTSKVVMELQAHLIEPLADLETNYFVFRDFQARNIMWDHEKISLIDYQSAMLGSRYYDLASLLYGSQAGLSVAQREVLLRYFFDKVKPEKKFDLFEEHFYLFVLLRRLRSLGSYGYLSQQKNKRGFFPAIQPTLEELVQLCRTKKAFYPFEYLYWMILEIQAQWPEVENRIREANPTAVMT